MSRVVQILAGVAVASAASATVQCDANNGANCSTCVGTGVAQVCATFQAPPAPICAGCGTGVTPGSALCSSSTVTSPTAACSVCVSLLGSAVGACVTTTAQVAPYLTANSTLSTQLGLEAFGKAAVFIDANADAQGTVDVPAGNNIVVLRASTTPITVNVAGSTSNNIFAVNSSLTVNGWNSAGFVKVNNNNNAELKVGQLNVGASASAENRFVVAQEGTASVSFQSINFASASSGSSSASLEINGGTAHFGGSASMRNNITGSGRIQLSNGVSVDGNIPEGVTVTVDASGTNAALASVEAGTVFNASGDVLISNKGSTSSSASANTDAIIAVNGNGVFIAGSASASGTTTNHVQPKVVLNQGSSFVINAGAAFTAQAVEIGAGAALVIGANVDRARVRVERIAKCAGAVRINLNVTAETFIAANTAGGKATSSIGFRYATSNNVNELVKCGVEVYDSSNTKYTLTSRTAAQASAGRRLLADSGSATWGDDQMTFEMQKQTNSAPVSFAVVPLLMVSMAGLLF